MLAASLGYLGTAQPLLGRFGSSIMHLEVDCHLVLLQIAAPHGEAWIVELLLSHGALVEEGRSRLPCGQVGNHKGRGAASARREGIWYVLLMGEVMGRMNMQVAGVLARAEAEVNVEEWGQEFEGFRGKIGDCGVSGDFPTVCLCPIEHFSGI